MAGSDGSCYEICMHLSESGGDMRQAEKCLTPKVDMQACRATAWAKLGQHRTLRVAYSLTVIAPCTCEAFCD